MTNWKDEAEGYRILAWSWGILCAFIFISAVTFNADDVDIDVLGKYMCKQHNLTFVDETHYCIDQFFCSIDQMEIQIVCKEPNTVKKVDDGYLVVLNQGGE